MLHGERGGNVGWVEVRQGYSAPSSPRRSNSNVIPARAAERRSIRRQGSIQASGTVSHRRSCCGGAEFSSQAWMGPRRLPRAHCMSAGAGMAVWQRRWVSATPAAPRATKFAETCRGWPPVAPLARSLARRGHDGENRRAPNVGRGAISPKGTSKWSRPKCKAGLLTPYGSSFCGLRPYFNFNIFLTAMPNRKISTAEMSRWTAPRLATKFGTIGKVLPLASDSRP